MWCCMRPSLSGRTACSDMDPRGTCFGCSVFVPPLSVWVSVLGGAARLEPPIGRTAARSRPLRTICWAPRANCLGKGRVDGSCACRWGCCQPAACGTSRCQWVGHLRPSWCRPLPLCRSTPRCSCLPLVRVPKRVWPVFFFFFLLTSDGGRLWAAAAPAMPAPPRPPRAGSATAGRVGRRHTRPRASPFPHCARRRCARRGRRAGPPRPVRPRDPGRRPAPRRARRRAAAVGRCRVATKKRRPRLPARRG